MRVAIVGGGLVGVLTARALARGGMTVTVIDPCPTGADTQASGGLVRLSRFEYGGDPLYPELARRSRAVFDELERIDGRQLVHEVGVLYLALDGVDDAWEQASYDVSRALGVGIEELSPAAIERRWPAIRSAGVARAFLSPRCAALRGRELTRAAGRAAADAGASFRRGRVVGLDPDGVTLDDGTRLLADQTVIATGAWTPRLLPQLPIRATRQPNLHFARGAIGIPIVAEGPHFSRFMTPELYGVGAKGGSHVPGEAGDPDAERAVRRAEEEGVRAFARERFALPFADEPIVHREVCFYAMTPTEDPIVARLDERTVVCAGLSGHGFKFAPELAAAAAALIVGGDPALPLDRFRLPAA